MMDRIRGIPLLFWLGVIDITSVTRFTSFLASVAVGLTSLLKLINRHKLLTSNAFLASKLATRTRFFPRVLLCMVVASYKNALTSMNLPANFELNRTFYGHRPWVCGAVAPGSAL